MKTNQIITDARLARLAWCVTLRRHSFDVEARVGSDVEISGDGLVEGAWSGDFVAFGFADALTFTGTGCIIRDGRLVACTPTHTLAPIYTLRKDASLHVSNSLPAILLLTDERLDPEYPHYDSDIMSIIFGVDRYTGCIPTVNRRSVCLHYFRNIEVSPGLELRVLEKEVPAGFRSFAEYDEFVAKEVGCVISNAVDKGRRNSFDPLTTVSSGYDSPACAVWAARAGTVDAITIAEARDGFSDCDDSGRAIAEKLGLKVTELSRESCSRPARPDAELEILCSGYGGDDLIWVGAEPLLADRLLMTGYHGDKIWSTHAAAVSRTVKRGDPSGASLLEFRLSVGFFTLPVPFIGCTRHPDIWRISVSDEMKNWSVGGGYDRPVPRRVVEAAGVAREQFGQSKKAIANPYQDTDAMNPPLEKTLSQATVTRFRADRGAGGIRRKLSACRFRVLGRVVTSHKVRRLMQWLGASKRLDRMRWKYRKPLSEHDFLMAWAVNALIEDRLGRNR